MTTSQHASNQRSNGHENVGDRAVAEYRKNGYHVVRGALTSAEVDEYRRHVQTYVRTDRHETWLDYPEPAKYTVAGNTMAKPGLASIVELPAVVSVVEALLGEPAYLTAYVAYVRTPGNKGGGAHCDYKRWRPVGSSMNWLFAVIPLNDFDETYGPLLVSPGSHKLTALIDPDASIRDLSAPEKDKLAPFIDPELKAGDLLLMDARTWHLPPPGTSTDDRCGFFLKYCAVNAPPAAGYYPYSNAAYDAVSDAGKRLIPIHFDEPINSTQLLVEKPSDSEPLFLLRRDADENSWELPGGPSEAEEEGVGWDIGARMGALKTIVEEQLRGETIPWMSYVDDLKSEDGVCRVYGYRDTDGSVDSAVQTLDRFEWCTADKVSESFGGDHELNKVIATWLRGDLIRGKGKPGSERKRQFD